MAYNKVGKQSTLDKVDKMTKICITCKLEKDETDFYVDKRAKSGRRNSCKTCRTTQNRELGKARYAREKGLIDSIKMGGCCLCDHIPETPDEMDLHHIDPTTKLGGAIDMLRTGIEKGWREVAKCALLCAICHRRLHAYERTDPVKYQKMIDSLLMVDIGVRLTPP